MRKLLSNLRRLLTFPFRLITLPFAAVREAINYEPEDTDMGEVFAQTLENPGVLLEHLEALRQHLFRALLALVLTTAVSAAFAPRILDWLLKPAGGLQATQAIEVTEGIGVFMKVSLLAGFALAFPYIGFEFFAFVNPGLKRGERKVVILIIPVAFLLFLSGMAFAYYVMLPVAIPFLLDFMGIPNVRRISSVINLVTNVMLWVGLAFQFPLVIFGLAAIGVVNARTLAHGWRFAVVGIAVLAAMITPTIDPINMALVMGPMILLYFISVLFAAIAQRGRKRRAQAGEAQPA